MRVNCGLIGLGTVGTGVVNFFADGPLELPLGAPELGGQASVPIHLWSASRRTRPPAEAEALIRQALGRAGERGSSRLYFDTDPADASSHFNHGFPSWRKIVEDPAVDIVIEVTGSPVAEAIIEEALWRGKCVVTANKKVMSRSGYALVRLAERRGAVLAYEASVGGGMPVVQMIGSSIGGRITALMAILNGTTNFILSRMWAGAQPAKTSTDAEKLYPIALAAAANRGLAEADPSDDVLGEDPRSKLIILAGLAFGVRLRPADVYLRGIARKGRLTQESIFNASDLAMLRSLSYVPKLLAGAQRLKENGRERIIAWVQPAGVSTGHPLAGVTDSENACLLRVESPLSQARASRSPGAPSPRLWSQSARPFEVMVRGPGAGGPETASSVISDIYFCARQLALAGRLGRRTEPGQDARPVYNYGSGAFSQSQEYTGVPSMCQTDALTAPFLLRFQTASAGGTSARQISAALKASGIDAQELPSTGATATSVYLKTAPASPRAIEAGIERVLATIGAHSLSMDVLYLPLLDGPAWAAAARP